MRITLRDVHTLCINTTVVIVNSGYSVHIKRRSFIELLAHLLDSLSIDFNLEIIVFGENTTNDYKNKNIIYSLLSRSN